MNRASRRTLKYALTASALAAGLVVGQAVLSSAPAAGPVLAQTTTSTADLQLAAASIDSLPTVSDRGNVTGVLTVAGPAEATEGRLVAVVQNGRKTVAKKSAAASSPVRISTKALPAGSYTLTLNWSHAGQNSVVALETFRVDRSPKRRPRPRPTFTAPAPTSPTTAPATAGPTAAPTTAAPTTAPAAPTTVAPTTAPATAAPTTTAAPTKAPTTTAPTTTAAPASGFAQQILELTNTARKDNGCNTPLRLNSQLSTAAQRHSDDMVAHDFFSHTGSDGSNPFQRMTDAGYQWSGAAENIAAGSTTAAATMQQWLNSAGHRANILNCGLVDLGVGYTVGTGATYAGYWVQTFASPR